MELVPRDGAASGFTATLPCFVILDGVLDFLAAASVISGFRVDRYPSVSADCQRPKFQPWAGWSTGNPMTSTNAADADSAIASPAPAANGLASAS
jgi:hypothetical protein